MLAGAVSCSLGWLPQSVASQTLRALSLHTTCSMQCAKVCVVDCERAHSVLRLSTRQMQQYLCIPLLRIVMAGAF